MSAPRRETAQQHVETLRAIAQLAADLPTAQMVRDMERAEIVGPFLDPTGFQDAVVTGRLARNVRLIRAVHAFAEEMRAIRDEGIADFIGEVQP